MCNLAFQSLKNSSKLSDEQELTRQRLLAANRQRAATLLAVVNVLVLDKQEAPECEAEELIREELL